ncbi:hypothetical protein CerSpe_070480 [Prunus speciosa]
MDASSASPASPLLESTNDSNTPSESRSAPRLTSKVWSFFEKVNKIESGKPVIKAKCVICNTLLVGNSSCGTSHLSRHLKKHEDAQARVSPGQMLLNADVAGNMTNFVYDHDVARKELVDFIIRAELPFTFVDSHDFKGLIQCAFCPQYKGISASTCKRDVLKKFDKERINLLAVFENLDSKICLTSDVWSSRQKMGYMSLTAHFIDKEWCLNKRIICFKMIEYPHTGESLATHIFDELLSWHIHNKIFTLSLDNASNNDSTASILPSTLLLDSVHEKLFHVRCCCHILNLIVQDGLKVLSPSIDKITDIVRSMNSSNKRHEIWVKCCSDFHMGKKNIDIDVPHRWNSTYELLHVALKYKAPLHRYVQKVNESRFCNLQVPSEEDWKIAQLVSGFLQIFYSSTKIFSGVYYPTSSRVINCLIDIHGSFAAYSEFYVFKDALTEMKTKFDKYWKEFPMVFCFATIMDPRFKVYAIAEWLDMIGIDQLTIDSKILAIKTLLFQLFDIYKKNVIPDVVQNVQNVVATSTGQTPGSISVPIMRNFSIEGWKRKKLSSSSSSSSTNTSELQFYLDLPTIEVVDDNQFSLLGWWKNNKSLYPIVSLMARDLLTIPASTVASESCFSAGGRVVSEKRASLSPSTIEALICLKDWALADSRKQDAAVDEQRAEELMNIRA